MFNLFDTARKHLKAGEYWIHKSEPQWYAIIEKIEDGRMIHYTMFVDGEPKSKAIPYPCFLIRYKPFPPLKN